MVLYNLTLLQQFLSVELLYFAFMKFISCWQVYLIGDMLKDKFFGIPDSKRHMNWHNAEMENTIATYP